MKNVLSLKSVRDYEDIFFFISCILVIFCIFTLGDCSSESETEIAKKKTEATVDGNRISVIVFDSCEYVYSSYRMAHKGNCRFCAERNHVLLHDTIIINKGIIKRDTVYIYKYKAL